MCHAVYRLSLSGPIRYVPSQKTPEQSPGGRCTDGNTGGNSINKPEFRSQYIFAGHICLPATLLYTALITATASHHPKLLCLIHPQALIRKTQPKRNDLYQARRTKMAALIQTLSFRSSLLLNRDQRARSVSDVGTSASPIEWMLKKMLLPITHPPHAPLVTHRGPVPSPRR